MKTVSGSPKKTITIDPRPEDPENLPELLKGFGAVPPLVTDIDLSLDDKYLYVACWGLGEMHQYDVSDPLNPVLNGKVETGWHWPQDQAPEWQRVYLWTADGRDQPRREAGLLDELALFLMGRSVLS